MRRLSLFVTAVAALLILPSSTHAQPSLRVSGGLAAPTSPDLFTDATAPGIAVELGPQFRLTNQLDLTVSVMHGRFPIVGTDALDSEAMTAWALSSRFLIHVLSAASTVRPYVTAGGGPYRLNRTPERTRPSIVCLANQPSHITGPCLPPPRTTRSKPEVGFGMQVGLGVSVALAPTLRAFVESTYTRLLFDDNPRYLPVQLGLRVQPAR